MALMSRMWAINYMLPCLLAVAVSCNSPDSPRDTPTSGNIRLSIDESFQPIVDSHVSTFQGIYKYATLNPEYKAEGEVFKDLLNDTSKVIVVSRELNEQEKAFLEQKKRYPKITRIAIDAVALIVHRNNPDSLLTMEQVKTIFAGKAPDWSSISRSNSIKNLTIVFDNNNSGTARFVKDSLLAGQSLPGNTYASNSHSTLIDYVSKNENAIGVLGVNWISDLDDTTAVGFLKKVRVVGISAQANPSSPDDYYQPYQAYIAQRVYPMLRYIYVINNEGRSGLGTGFASFIAGDQGQRIFLKSGLVPATMPVRVIGVRNN